jgi:hypothetical protein
VHTSVDEPSALDLQLRAGTTVVGGKRVARRAAGAGTVTLRLGARARRRLERSPRGRAISLVVTARDAAGNARVVGRRVR